MRLFSASEMKDVAWSCGAHARSLSLSKPRTFLSRAARAGGSTPGGGARARGDNRLSASAWRRRPATKDVGRQAEQIEGREDSVGRRRGAGAVSRERP